jgi:hypothetical protein
MVSPPNRVSSRRADNCGVVTDQASQQTLGGAEVAFALVIAQLLAEAVNRFEGGGKRVFEHGRLCLAG